jgi:hypothetical protein
MGLGSGIRKKPIPDPGVKKAPDPGSAALENGTKINAWMYFMDDTKEVTLNRAADPHLFV